MITTGLKGTTGVVTTEKMSTSVVTTGGSSTDSVPETVFPVTWQVSDGIITAPFVLVQGMCMSVCFILWNCICVGEYPADLFFLGYVSQPIETGATTGGKLAFTFTLSKSGKFVVSANVSALSGSSNSVMSPLIHRRQQKIMCGTCLWQLISFRGKCHGVEISPATITMSMNLTVSRNAHIAFHR